MELFRNFRFDLLVLLFLGVYAGISMLIGDYDQIGANILVFIGLLGVFQLFSRVRTVADFLIWFGDNWNRDWRVWALYGIFLAFAFGEFVEGRLSLFEGVKGFLFYTAGFLAYLALHCRFLNSKAK